MKSFQVLENWKPRVFNERNIRRKMLSIVNSLEIPQHKGFIEVRDPKENLQVWKRNPTQSSYSVRRWHIDLSKGGYKKKDVYILMWSNQQATEFRNRKTKKVTQIKSGDIVLVRNLKFEHRVFPKKPRGRWFARHFWGVKDWKRPNQD